MTSPPVPLVTLKEREGCWVCRYRKKPCQVFVEDLGNQGRPCYDCTRFNIRCSGRGLPRPPETKSKQIIAKTKPWIRNRNLLGPPLDPFSGGPEQALEALAFPGPSFDLMIPPDTAGDDNDINIPGNPAIDVDTIGSQLSQLDNRESGPTVALGSGLNQMIPRVHFNDYWITDGLAPYLQSDGSLTASGSVHTPQPVGSFNSRNLDQGLGSINLEQAYVGQTPDSDVPDDGSTWNAALSASAFWEKDYGS